jgi:hypothetical protein
MDRLRFGHERPTDSDCCLICTCLSVRNFENVVEHESSPTVLSSAGLGMPGTHS